MISPHDLMALGASLCWAITGVLSAKPAKMLGAVTFVRWRMSLVLPLLWFYCLLFVPMPSLSWSAIVLMAVSGVVGIFIGDLALFLAMNRIGPRRTGVLFATHALFSALLGFLFLNERLSWSVYAGALVTVAGVMIAISAQPQGRAPNPMTESDVPAPTHLGDGQPLTTLGVGFALIAALCQALGALIAKPLLSTQAPYDLAMHPMLALAIRVSAAALLLWLWRGTGAQPARPHTPFTSRLFVTTMISGVIGMIVGMGLLLWALQKGAVGTVGVLSSLSPLLILPILWVTTKKRPPLGAWIGALVALFGVNLVVFR